MLNTFKSSRCYALYSAAFLCYDYQLGTIYEKCISPVSGSCFRPLCVNSAILRIDRFSSVVWLTLYPTCLYDCVRSKWLPLIWAVRLRSHRIRPRSLSLLTATRTHRRSNCPTSTRWKSTRSSLQAPSSSVSMSKIKTHRLVVSHLCRCFSLPQMLCLVMTAFWYIL